MATAPSFRLNRRRFLAFAGGAALPILAACQGTSAPTAAPAATKAPAAQPSTTPATTASAPAPAATGAAPKADRVVIAMGQQPDTLMPRVGSMMARTEVLGALHVEPVRSDDKGNWVAMAAESVPTLENGGAKWVGDGDDKHLEV